MCDVREHESNNWKEFLWIVRFHLPEWIAYNTFSVQRHAPSSNLIQNIFHTCVHHFSSRKGKFNHCVRCFKSIHRLPYHITHMQFECHYYFMIWRRWKMKKYKNLKSFKMSPIDLSNTHQIPIRTYDDESIRLISHRFYRSMSPKK